MADKADHSDNMSRVQWVQQDKDTWVPKNPEALPRT